MTLPIRPSSGATLLVAMLAVPAEKVAGWRAASDAGSGLPWWTPIAVTGVLFLASVLYKFTHRPRPPQDSVQGFQTDPMSVAKPSPDTDRENFWGLLTE